MVAAEHDPPGQREAQMIRRMPRRINCLDPPGSAFDALPMPEATVRPEAHVDQFLPGWRARSVRASGQVAPESERLGAGFSLECRDTLAVIGMRVGEHDAGDAFAAPRKLVQQGLPVALVIRPRIDDRDLALPENISVGALEGERAFIGGNEPPQARRDLLQDTAAEIDFSVEGYGFHGAIPQTALHNKDVGCRRRQGTCELRAISAMHEATRQQRPYSL